MLLNEIEDLLLNISFKDEEMILANVSFSKLYVEYSQFVMNVIASYLKGMRIYDEELAQAVLNNTFLIVYEKPLKFSVPNGAENDKCFKGWLAKISQNELRSQIKQVTSQEKRFSDLNLQEENFELEDVEIDFFESANHKILAEALNSLSERERGILLAHYLYYEEGKKMPSCELDRLCLLYSTTKPNLRQIRGRSEKKIIEYMTKHSQLKPLKNVK